MRKVMNKSIFTVIILFAMSFSNVASAACTPEEAQAKAQAFTTALTEFAQKDPNKYAEVAQAMQTELPELQKNTENFDALCKFYDDWTAKMK